MTEKRPLALVTGAAKRVGQAIAIELANSGFDLALHYRNSSVQQTRERCEQAGATVSTHQAELGDLDGCQALIDSVSQQHTTLSLLVNNASIFRPAAFDEATMADWDAMMNINLRAPFLLSQGLLPLLRKGCLPGPQPHAAVVHMTDIGGERPLVGYAPYAVSKAGLIMLVKAMAVELAPQIRTLGISPGEVLWPDDYPEAVKKQREARIPMGRCGSPQDIARLVRFVALEGGYLNGEVLAVDGGLHVRY